jgi:DNA-damage-inducible protein J
MATNNALIQTRIDPAVKEEAAAVLEAIGLTISDAVRILLTRTAKEGALPFELTHNPAAYDAWFREKLREALDDIRPALPDDAVKTRFAKRRAAALGKAEGREP